MFCLIDILEWEGVGSEGAAITPEFQMDLQEKQVCQKGPGWQGAAASVKGSGEDAAALSRGLQDPFIL